MEVENPTPVLPGSRPSSAAPAHEQAWELLALEKEEEDALLRELAGGIEDLAQATALQAVINTSSSTVSHLGSKLPSLVELNFNGSVIQSVRDLGTGFQCLRVLWISRCGLTGLQGIGAMAALHELYASFNDVADLQPLDACSALEVLDLEGNCVAELDSAIYLTACTSLQCLTLAGNPVAQAHDYRYQIVNAVPGLEVLDDVQVLEQDRSAPPPAPPAAISIASKDNLSQQVETVGRQVAGSSHPSTEENDAHPLGAQASNSTPACSTANEFELVCSAIKHARVGVDSQEFQEAEMLTLLGGLPGTLGAGTLCISADGAAAGFSSLSTSRPPPTSGSEANSYSGISGASALQRPSTSSALMPPTAGSWIRAVRSSQAGALASLRASRTTALQSPLANGAAMSQQGTSSSSTGPSPAGSRPSTAATGEQEQGVVSGNSIGGWMGGPQAHSFSAGSTSHAGAASNPYLARPVSAAVGGRPASARPGTLSSLTAPGTRPGTGASAPAVAGGGLYWKKHRIIPAAGPGSSLSESLLDGINAVSVPSKEAALLDADGVVVTSSSALTYGGGEAIGGNLAKDLRRRRKGTGKDAQSSGPSAAEAARQLLRIRGSSGPLGTALAMSYDSEALLQELIRWKLETADRALAVEEDQDQGCSAVPWNDNDAAPLTVHHDLLSVGSSRGAGKGTDVLQLAEAGCGGDVEDTTAVPYLLQSPSGRRSGAAASWKQREGLQGLPAAHPSTSPVASSLPLKGSKGAVNNGWVDGNCEPSSLHQQGPWEEPGLQAEDAACAVQRSARRTMLAKVVRDVAASKDLTAAVQSWAAEIISEEPVFVKDSKCSGAGTMQLTKALPSMTRTLSKQSSVGGRGTIASSSASSQGRVFQRAPSARSTEASNRQQQPPVMHRSTSLSASATTSGRVGSARSAGKDGTSVRGSQQQQVTVSGGPGCVQSSSRQPASHHASYEERLSTKSRPQLAAAAAAGPQQGCSELCRAESTAPSHSAAGNIGTRSHVYSVSCATGEVALAHVNPRPVLREDDPLQDSLDDD